MLSILHRDPRSSFGFTRKMLRRDQEQEGKRGNACAAEDKRGKSAKTLQGYNPPQGFLPLHCIATRLEICPFLTQVQFNERVTQREYDNYSNPRTVCQQPNRHQGFLYFECTVISVIMPPPHFYRKYAPPFFEGSFLNILR